MLRILLEPDASAPLVTQIVNGFRNAITSNQLLLGSRAPSIRKFAHAHEVSHFTVVEAYDRLVAEGFLQAIPHKGFYARLPYEPAPAQRPTLPDHREEMDFDAYMLLHQAFQQSESACMPGVGTLPEEWMETSEIAKGLRSLARTLQPKSTGYGSAKGLDRLRAKISGKLAENHIQAHPEQIMLTNGASQALDLLVRYLVKPGDAVMVDSPGYHNLFLNLHLYGAKLCGIPRGVHGIDFDALEEMIKKERPKVFFTNTRLHCPTGSSLGLAMVHRLLQITSQNNILMVENDIYGDLDPSEQQLLASMDQLTHVIYVGSFSKTISPALRVGFIAARRELIDELVPLKLVSGLTTSAISEEIILDTLSRGHYRKHVFQLRQKLANAHEIATRRLEDLGISPLLKPFAGLFLWARHPEVEDSTELAIKMRGHGVILAPGQLFMPDASVSPWMRFNVTQMLNDQASSLLEEALKRT